MKADFSVRIVPILYQTSCFSLPPSIISRIKAVESIADYVITNSHVFREYVSWREVSDSDIEVHWAIVRSSVMHTNIDCVRLIVPSFGAHDIIDAIREAIRAELEAGKANQWPSLLRCPCRERGEQVSV